MPRTFREATDLLCLSAVELAELFDRPAQTVRQMRLDESHPNYRRPPEGWEKVLEKIARKRGGELTKLADELARR